MRIEISPPGTGISALFLFSALLLSMALPPKLDGQVLPSGAEEQTGWEKTGIPALNYDSDQGFGYGLLLALYNYGGGGFSPYRFTIQPRVFLSTKGRRDFTAFFDAPHVLPGGWRLDGFLGFEKQIATPYYGPGNDAPFLKEKAEGENPYYYRFGRKRTVFRGNLQRPLGTLPLRVLFGFQVANYAIDPTPENQGTTLLMEELGAEAAVPGGRQNSVRGGIIWDSRDRESGPGKGVWTAFLVERVDKALGSESSFTRLTLTDRRYFTVRDGLVFANRVTLQDVSGEAPFYALSYVQSSFEEQEALGGSKSVRGVLRNRYFGEGLFLWNAEVRWRFKEFTLLGRSGHLAAIGFLDSGRVWEGGVELAGLLSDLHHGGGGGIRVGLGPNFVIAVDFATGSEVTLQTYIGLGYLF